MRREDCSFTFILHKPFYKTKDRTQQAISRNIYVNTDMHAIMTNGEKETLNLKESRKWYREGFEGFQK